LSQKPELPRSNSVDDNVIAAQLAFIQQAANRPLVPEPMLKILTSIEGKDRVFRITFFALKVLRSVTQREMEPVQLFETALLDSRRVFRLFREVEPLQALLRNIVAPKKDLILKAGAVVQLGGLIGFLVSNHLILFTKVKLLRLDGGRLRQLFGWFLLIAQTAGVVLDLRRMWYLKRAFAELRAAKQAILQAPDQDSAKQRERLARVGAQEEELRSFGVELAGSMLKHATEHVTCYCIIRGAYGKPWSNGMIGTAGTTTSAIQLWQLWRTTSTKKALGARQAVENFTVDLE